MKKKRLSFPALLFLCATLVFAFPALGTGQEQAVPQGLLLVLGDAAREGEPLVRLETGPFTGLSRRSLLRAAFQVLGWGHELDLSEAFFPGKGLESLSAMVDPPPPSPFLEAPNGEPGRPDLQALVEWVRECRIDISCDISVPGERVTLKVHRRGIAPQNGQWEILVEAGIPLETAPVRLLELAPLGLPVGLRRSGQDMYDLVAGPFPTFLKAREAFPVFLPRPGLLLLPSPSFQGPAPLFWASLVTPVQGISPRMRFASEIGLPRAKLSEIAMDSGAEAGINGGFFSSAGPVGTLVFRGELLHGSWKTRSALGLGPGLVPLFGPGGISMSLRHGTASITLDRFNEIPKKDETSIFLENGFLHPPHFEESVDQAVVPVRAALSGSFSKPALDGLLVGRGQGALRLEGIASGDEVEITARWDDSRFEGREWVLQAGPRLVENNLGVSPEESFDPDTRLKRHPRSIVGWDGSSLWWIVVDGREDSHSTGLTLPETVALATSLGLKEALNLDGGGSSAIWWRGRLVTLPPGGKERPLPYAILFGTDSKALGK